MSLQDNKPPITPTADGRYSSIRSILRDRNTPATGQSVRFFSRDAYKVITPDVSSASSEPDEISFAARLNKAKARPAAQELFANSPPSTPSMLGPGMPSMLTQVPPPNVSNIFDMSAEMDMPIIPAGQEVPMLDSAVEITEADAPNEDEEKSIPPTPPAKTGLHDRSHSFSFGQTVFRSLASPMEEARTSTPPPASTLSKSRSRALSDTVFHSFGKGAPEADINDTSALQVYSSRPPSPHSPPRPKEKDPFGAHATTFFTPGTVPPTPPDHPVHARKVSREEDHAWRLQTALALKSELCVQYEADLAARDELVALLQQRIAECERELDRRKGHIKGWRKRVAELEKCVRGLSDEVERSREEASERSVMDEASGAALREMHRKLNTLERECRERERREESMREEMSMREEELEKVRERATEQAEDRLAQLLAGHGPTSRPSGGLGFMPAPPPPSVARLSDSEREKLRAQLRAGTLDDREVEVETAEASAPPFLRGMGGQGMEELGANLQELFKNMPGMNRTRRRKVRAPEALRLMEQEEAGRLVDTERVQREALTRAETHGIVFLDEIDKIASREGGAKGGPDVSREGVQRDLLPIVEGSTVNTKYGQVKTDHILFIAAGAFHVSKPSDLIPELQGRFPIRVELEPLRGEDLVRILREPRNSLLRQYTALLETEGVRLDFSDDAVEELARIAQDVNERTENIGARRLHTVLERLLDEVSFNASEQGPKALRIDAAYVRERLASVVQDEDLSRYIL